MRGAVTVPCSHPRAVPVESAGQTVAGLCPDCDVQLPAAWFTCDHANAVEISELSEPPGRMLCLGPCGATFWEGE
jgi:hypothetical protein